MTQITPPTPPTWSRVKAILADALDLDPGQRDAFLDQACAGQPAVRRRLADLVRAYSGSLSLNDEDSPARAIVAPFEPRAGSSVGRYRIIRLIGRGGMGAVYEAFDDQLARPVAIKFMQAGIASRSMLKRFDLESRILARLRHPGIAQIFEAGTIDIPGSAEHVPFFAMELVNGARPITAFADARKLSIEQRLALFIDVCDAVTHGHQRSVIHRDLKPANILVDASGQPKIIDFGVARATDPGAAATTLAGELLGTLRYMSPEHISGCDGDPDDLDVRTDVYSLGVVLYELLTGQPPHPDPEGGVLASIREACNRTPVPLSRFRPDLSGDIQVVALKAVQPDRHARYQSVAEFSADLGRVLRHEPISARPLSAVYQLRLFARRHRPLVVGFAMGLAALLLGLIGTSIGFVRARDATHTAQAQSARAQRIAAFLRNTIRSADPQLLPAVAGPAMDFSSDPFESWTPPSADWGSAGPAEVGIAGVLRHAAKHIDSDLGDDPATKAEASILIGFTLCKLEDVKSALPLFETALDVQSRIFPADDETTLRSRILYAQALAGVGRTPDADAQYRAAHLTAQRRFGPYDPRTLRLLDAVAVNLGHIKDRYDEGLSLARQTIREVAQARGPDSAEVWLRHAALVSLLNYSPYPSHRSELIPECRATIDGLTRSIGHDAGPIALVCLILGNELQSDIAKLAEAESLQRRSLDIQVKARGPDAAAVYDARTALLAILLRQRKLDEGESLARTALESSLRMIGPRSPYTLKAEARLARVLTWLEKDPEEAERLAHHASDGATLYYGAAEDFAAYHHAIWAAAVRLRHHPEQAETMLRDRIAFRGSRTPQPESAWVEAYQYLQLALCLADQNRPDEAAAAIRTARTWAEKLGDPLHSVLLNVLDVQERLEPGSDNEKQPH